MRVGMPNSKGGRVALTLAFAFGLGAWLLSAFATAHEPRDADRGGLSAGVSAVDALPAVGSLPPDVAKWVAQSARDIGNDPARATRRVRKLRSSLGARRSDLYAYREENGAICLDLTSQAASCPESADNGPPGIDWISAGGWESIPRNVVGLVADSVRRVSLFADGTSRVVPIVNNSIFAELPSDDSAELRLEFRDGSTRTVTVPGVNGQALLPPLDA
jgi:hypothetical protein